MANKFTRILFSIYVSILIWIIIFKLGIQFSYMTERRVNLIPFGGRFIFNSGIILNTLIFVPFGIFTGILFQQYNFKIQVLFFFFTSFTIEAFQFILKIGAFDITDIITNTVGGSIGFMTFVAFRRVFKNKLTAQKVFNFIAACGTALVLVLLILLRLSMLPIRYQ